MSYYYIYIYIYDDRALLKGIPMFQHYALSSYALTSALLMSSAGQESQPDSRRYQPCRSRKRATSVPAEGPSYRLDFANRCEFPLRTLQAQKWHAHGYRTFGAA